MNFKLILAARREATMSRRQNVYRMSPVDAVSARCSNQTKVVQYLDIYKAHPGFTLAFLLHLVSRLPSNIN
jgi:hypothetical protein